MPTAREENAMTLGSLLGIGVEEATQLLDCAVAIRWDQADGGAASIARHLRTLLSRTVAKVTENSPSEAAAEVVIGAMEARHPNALRISVGPEEIRIGGSAPAAAIADGLPIVALLTACYAAGMAIKAALGPSVKLPGPTPETGLSVQLSTVLGTERRWAIRRVSFDRTHLAGAGAIGNAFLYGLATFDVKGELVVVDHDTITDGNLNRCLFFEPPDVGQLKAHVLAMKASSVLPAVSLKPESVTLEKLGKASKDPRWLNRLVVGVDSRRARRSLQMELPREVFDASTTGSLECVFHHHIQPTELACLACIYTESTDEEAHERHVASTLGVTLADVQERTVTQTAGERIHSRYPDITVPALVGQSYDSLFKALCGKGLLRVNESQQVLAPLAFVSVLAGAYLAVEFVRRLSGDSIDPDFNYWRLSPWSAPVIQLRSLRPRAAGCSFCDQPAFARTIRQLWG